MKHITILTNPYFADSFTKIIARHLKQKVKNFIENFKYHEKNKKYKPWSVEQGHKSVTGSLISGLKRINYNFSFNDKNNISDKVIVLSGINTLKQSIKLKQQGKIKTLIAGPNITNLPSEYDRILTQSEIDMCILPSNWIKVLHENDEAILKGKIKVWAAGIDAEYWQPDQDQVNAKNNNVLIYNKTKNKRFLESIKSILKKYNYETTAINCGHYTKDEFKNLLSKSLFSVFLSASETQGMSLAESWAMDIPTIVWNPGFNYISGKKFPTSSCPYLGNQTGIQFKNIDEFEKVIKTIKTKIKNFNPRNWILENMTDEICAKNLLRIVESCKTNQEINHDNYKNSL